MGLSFGEKSTVQSWVYDRRIGAHRFARVSMGVRRIWVCIGFAWISLLNHRRHYRSIATR
jgi:hypothetical protein